MQILKMDKLKNMITVPILFLVLGVGCSRSMSDPMWEIFKKINEGKKVDRGHIENLLGKEIETETLPTGHVRCIYENQEKTRVMIVDFDDQKDIAIAVSISDYYAPSNETSRKVE